jgi:hypothetical protein
VQFRESAGESAPSHPEIRNEISMDNPEVNPS